MNIYFLAAISGMSKYESKYREIVKLLEDDGHFVVSDHILNRNPDSDPEEYPVQDDTEYFNLVKSRIRTADLVVADLSHPTINIGYEIAFALENDIPVIVTYYKASGFVPSPLLNGDDSGRLIVSPYSDNLHEVLSACLRNVEGLEERNFTIRITPQILDYLNYISVDKKINRSSYLKNLIWEKMSKDSKYKKAKKF